jgi:lysophospholipase L1-like esterase
MYSLRLFLSTLLLSASLSLVHAQQPAAPEVAKPDASAAIEKKGNAGFRQRHEAFLARGKSGPIGVLFLGDSITAGWTKAPDVWQQYYGKYEPANFGISGDQTQHVIWRIENGELDGIKPKVVVLMLGTNNTGAHTADEIAAADKKIVQLILKKIPTTKVLVLAVFPRGPRPEKQGTINDDGVSRMKIIRDVNAQLARLDNGNNIRFLDINAKFLGADGKIPDSIMPDQLHPNAEGYKIWAQAMQPTLDAMMR